MRYIRKNSLWVKKEDEIEIGKVDSLLLDIDGVLIDVTESFREAISLTTFEVLRRNFGIKGEERPLLPEDVKLFKQRRGFNNDWELTQAAIIFFLYYILKGDENFSELSRRKKHLARWLDEVEGNGGGLKGTLKYFERIGGKKGKSLLKKAPFEVTKRIFQEIYAGKENCKELYGFEPKFCVGRGLIGKEKIIIPQDDLRFFKGKIGLITGRTREEADYAVKKCSLEDLLLPRAVVVDDGTFPPKPNPDALLFLTELLESKVGVYIGDSFDDWLMVKEFAKIAKKRKVLSAMVVKEDEFEKYIREGVSILSQSSREIVKFIIKEGKSEKSRDKKENQRNVG